MMSWTIAIIIVSLIFGVTTIGITVDIAALSDRRNDARKAKLRNICPHVTISSHGDDLRIDSKIEMIPLSMTSQCMLCGGIMPKNADNHRANSIYWAARPKECKKAVRKAFRLRRKIR